MMHALLLLLPVLASCGPAHKAQPEAPIPPAAAGETSAETSALPPNPVQVRAQLQKDAAEAVALLASGRYEDARQALDRLRDVERHLPDDARVAYDLGLAHEQVGDSATARESYRKAVALDPTLGSAWLRLGLLEDRDGRLPEALATWRQGIQRIPDDVDLRVAEMSALLRMGRYAEVEASAKTALEVNANALPIYSNLALAYIEQGKLDLAKFVLQRAFQSLEGAEQDAHVHAFLGRIHYLQGNKGEARTQLKRALELDPNLVPAIVYLCEIYLDDRSFDQMVPLLERARTLAPNEPAVRMNLGIAYRGTGRFDDALKEYEAVLSLEPDRTEPYLNLAILYGDHLKDYPKAIAVLETYQRSGGADPTLADSWIVQFEKEKEKADKIAARKQAAEEARKKREEEQRFLEDFERRKKEEEARQAAEPQPPTPETQPPTPETEPGTTPETQPPTPETEPGTTPETEPRTPPPPPPPPPPAPPPPPPPG
ncbi:MAG: tetratricopeptide repeat protein, partial [Deltaproteobacteria bacterium]|nr:tetratricopeptide repeat protein [Deltaproteobacteria bacterium]